MDFRKTIRHTGSLTRVLFEAALIISICGCTQPSSDVPARLSNRTIDEARSRVRLGPGEFHITELGSTATSGVYLASTGEPPICEFEVQIEEAKPTKRGVFSFSEGALLRRPKSDCTEFLSELAKELGFSGELPKPKGIDRLPVPIAILGTKQSRLSDSGGGFSSKPPGNWTLMKLFLRDGEDEGEVFMNINDREGLGEFSIKDEEYATIVVTELAKVLLPQS